MSDFGNSNQGFTQSVRSIITDTSTMGGSRNFQGGGQTLLRRKGVAPGDPHTVMCPVSARIRGVPVSLYK